MPELSDRVRKKLAGNPSIDRITDTQVIFTPKFKIQAVELNLQGRNPRDIFIQAGIDVSLFKDDFPKKTVSRWKKIYQSDGPDALKEERRGLNSVGRPKSTMVGDDSRALAERVAYLEAENFILKKLNALAAKSRKKKGLK